MNRPISKLGKFTLLATSSWIWPLPAAYQAYLKSRRAADIDADNAAAFVPPMAEPPAGEQESTAEQVASRFLPALQERWHGVDFTSEIFLAGMSNVSSVSVDNANQLTFTMLSGSKFVHLDNHQAGEFIGVASSKAKSQPITDEDADDIAALAVARGWKVINVHGTPADKDKLWFAAKAAGLEVKGYTPSEEAIARYESYLADDAGISQPLPDPVTRLIEHGHAPYKNEDGASQSYFVTIEDEAGERQTFWGVDLERAVADSGAEVGSAVNVANLGSQPVTLPDGTKTHRNTWRIDVMAEQPAADTPAETVADKPAAKVKAAAPKL